MAFQRYFYLKLCQKVCVIIKVISIDLIQIYGMPSNLHFEIRTERPSLNSPCNGILIIFKTCSYLNWDGVPDKYLKVYVITMYNSGGLFQISEMTSNFHGWKEKGKMSLDIVRSSEDLPKILSFSTVPRVSRSQFFLKSKKIVLAKLLDSWWGLWIKKMKAY